MKIYLVGGAVRDKLLGLDVTERDYVVVGATPQMMLDQGFEQVGKAFPVFLHPKTREEYALARKEVKTEKGYHGFECDASPQVTLEEDLMRRDLTINAIAEDEDGTLIDPYHGIQDIEHKVLRHVSEAFIEDPVRLLRVGRFLARYEQLGFHVHPTTIDLMQRMVQAGEVDHLVPERVWKEMEKALSEKKPLAFIHTLNETQALKKLFPELHRLYGVPQKAEYHPEIDTGVHIEMVLDVASHLTDDKEVRFAALLHDLGKGLTPKEEWPSHRGHEARGVKPIKDLCERFKIPNAYRDLAVLVSRFHLHVHRAFELKPSTIVELFENLDLFRKPKRLEKVLLACQADYQGRRGFTQRPYPQADYLRKAYEAALSVSAKEVIQGKEYPGDVIKEKVHQARVGVVKQFVNAQKKPQ